MRNKIIRTLALALLLCGVGMTAAQQQAKKVRVEEEEQAPRIKPQAKKVRVGEEEDAPRAKQKAPPAKSKLKEMLAEALKNKGELDWPESLLGSAFKDSREQLNALMQRVYKSVDSGNNPDPATLNDLQGQYRKLREVLRNNVSKLKPDEYIEANKYLKEIGETIAALQDPNIGHQFRSGRKEGSMGKAAPPEKSKLEEMLAEALKNNPDIRVAAAKLAEADAELNRTRVQVMQKIVALHAAIASKKTEIAYREKQYKRYADLQASRAIDAKLVDEAEDKLALAKAQLEELEAQLPGLLGKVQKSSDAQAAAAKAAVYHFRLISDATDVKVFSYPKDVASSQAKVNISQAEKMRKALQTPVKVDYENRSFDDILKDLAKKVPGLSFRNLFSEADSAERMSLHFEETLPASAILQALTDEAKCSFYVREYGILAAEPNAAPPGAMTVEEFLRQKPAKDPTVNYAMPLWSGLPWNPPDNIEGKITKITPDGSVYLSLNSVDGLLNGHALHLYRPSDEPSKTKYLGTIQILNIPPSRQQGSKEGIEVMGRPVGRLSEPPKVGDKVSVRPPSGVKFLPKKFLNPFDGGKNPPTENVEGLVKAVDASGLMTLTIGSDAGLAKGHTLELFRLNPSAPTQSKYLGTVRILEAEAHQAVAQPVGRLSSPPQRGDRVASRIQGN